MKTETMFSSATEDWATPQEFFDELDAEFLFTLDPCADDKNHKCEKYFTKEQNGLEQSWAGETVYCNPPYGRNIDKWIRKAVREAKDGAIVVMLIPARTDTKWFHEQVFPFGDIRFVKGRLKFGDGKNNAPFPSMVVVFTQGTVGRWKPREITTIGGVSRGRKRNCSTDQGDSAETQ
jgi:site-specific DNA-methyltransferase (adenine-specific)